MSNSFVKRCWTTGLPLLRRISVGGSRDFAAADKKLGARMMMSTGVNSTPSSRIMSPWLMLPPVSSENGDMVYKFYNHSEDKEESFPRNSEEEISDGDDAKFVGSSHGWLALLNHRSNNNNHLFLYNPITRRQIKLPPTETLPDPVKTTPDGRLIVSKLILSSSPDDDKCIAMMIFGRKRRLAFCHPCFSIEWTLVGELYDIVPEYEYAPDYKVKAPKSYHDIVYSSTRKVFFCLSGFKLECWDLADSLSPRIHSSFGYLSTDLKGQCMLEDKVRGGWGGDYPRLRRHVNLVYSEEYNQLFVVMRYVMEQMGPDGLYVKPIFFDKYRGWSKKVPYRTFQLDAYKVDFGVEKLVYLEGSLDGLAMFIGINHSIAMSSPTTESKLGSNCIYYTDSNRNGVPPSPSYGGHDIGVFDYTNRTISPYGYFPIDVESIKRIMPAPMWFTPCHH
ncbi:hypothetical protein CASFOL_031213 [Castilleja foliolosa]|uniref:KIB1-4 beta-propeller domain-containing protein n=1 Tax=Castilleja foliolosa TaxID=1961234 RepID=A0ABD3C426_9LAMI